MWSIQCCKMFLIKCNKNKTNNLPNCQVGITFVSIGITACHNFSFDVLFGHLNPFTFKDCLLSAVRSTFNRNSVASPLLTQPCYSQIPMAGRSAEFFTTSTCTSIDCCSRNMYDVYNFIILKSSTIFCGIHYETIKRLII